MDFSSASQLSALLAKEYAEEFFRLLVNYQDISASEAASRLNLHIKTAQDFLDGLTDLEIVTRTEVHEKKRPYNRYTLKEYKLNLTIDLHQFAMENSTEGLTRLIREALDAGAKFDKSRSEDAISAVTIWEGEGRDRKERRISLTTPQGKFLFHLPFPNAKPMSITDLMEKAGVEEDYSSEIQNLVEELVNLKVIELLD
jgi:predicted transcriptional regulator